ncbi:MAG: adenylate/guanylate cyclase domain-containing protein [Planctomycetota bacterium]
MTTLFADVAGSTGIYEKLGDEEGRNLVARCVEKLRQIAEQHTGQFVKSNGDDIMCTFPEPQSATSAACAMQCYIDEFSKEQLNVEVAVRIGFQHGLVMQEIGGDVRGDAVNVAARLADYAKAGQIVTSEKTLSAFKTTKSFRRLERVRLKGKTERVGICEILWKQDFSMTIFASDIPEEDAENLQLLIRLGDQICSVSENNFKITIGRDPSSDIRVTGKRASRHHATIEFRRGAFVLSDLSTNATYVRQGLEETRLHREQSPIIGSGQLSLGIPFNKNPEEIIELSSEC